MSSLAMKISSQADTDAVTDLPFGERRPSRRKRQLLPAVGTTLGGQRTFDCNIRDISESGARIAFPKSAIFPCAIYLINLRGRVAHKCDVVWCGQTEAGVAFVETLPPSSIEDPAMGFLRRLWLERAVR